MDLKYKIQQLESKVKELELEKLYLVKLCAYQKNALDEIAKPVHHMRIRAEREGLQLDGVAANYNSINPEYLKDIARKALRENEDTVNTWYGGEVVEICISAASKAMPSSNERPDFYTPEYQAFCEGVAECVSRLEKLRVKQ